jgi:hypothetical protein
MSWSSESGSKYYPPEVDEETNLLVGGYVKEREVIFPHRVTLQGRLVRIEPMQTENHLDDLFEVASQQDTTKRHRYLFEAPPCSKEEVLAFIRVILKYIDLLTVFHSTHHSSKHGWTLSRQILSSLWWLN